MSATLRDAAELALRPPERHTQRLDEAFRSAGEHMFMVILTAAVSGNQQERVAEEWLWYRGFLREIEGELDRVEEDCGRRFQEAHYPPHPYPGLLKEVRATIASLDSAMSDASSD